MDEDTRKGTIKLWHKIKHDDYAVSEFYHVTRKAVHDMLLIGGCTVFGFGFGWLSGTHWEHKWVDKWYAGHPLNGLRLSPPDPLIVTSKSISSGTIAITPDGKPYACISYSDGTVSCETYSRIRHEK